MWVLIQWYWRYHIFRCDGPLHFIGVDLPLSSVVFSHWQLFTLDMNHTPTGFQNIQVWYLISEEGFWDVVFFNLFWILENPGKIWSKSFMSLSWTCFALASIFVQTLCCFQWIDCTTSVLTRWDLEQQPPGVTESQQKTVMKLVVSSSFLFSLEILGFSCFSTFF